MHWWLGQHQLNVLSLYNMYIHNLFGSLVYICILLYTTFSGARSTYDPSWLTLLNHNSSTHFAFWVSSYNVVQALQYTVIYGSIASLLLHTRRIRRLFTSIPAPASGKDGAENSVLGNEACVEDHFGNSWQALYKDGSGAHVTLYTPLCNFIWSPPYAALSRAAQPHLQTFWGHAKVELGPPTPSQWPAIKEGFSK